MENFYQNKRSRKLLRICKSLLIFYQELQLYDITSQPVLVLLKREEKLRIETNISGHTIEGVLS